MRLLALDAALGASSVALVEDAVCLGERHGAESRSATASLPGLVQDLLATHGWNFDAVAVTVGPGGFTGLRGALALANGLALGAGVTVVGVTVAEALLADWDGPPGAAVWIALDSRRAGRVFLCRHGGVEAVAVDALHAPAYPVTVIGDSAAAVAEALRRAGAVAQSAGCGCVSAVAVARVARLRLVPASRPVNTSSASAPTAIVPGSGPRQSSGLPNQASRYFNPSLGCWKTYHIGGSPSGEW